MQVLDQKRLPEHSGNKILIIGEADKEASVQIQETHKWLPKGTCLPEQVKRYTYLSTFIKQPSSYLHVLPSSLSSTKFIAVKTVSQQNGKSIIKLYYHPTRTFLLSARKQANNIGCNYIISRSQQPIKDQFSVGKLRGNFSANQFSIFDNGDNPSRSPKVPRKQLGCVKMIQKSVWSSSEAEYTIMVVPKPDQVPSQIYETKRYAPMSFVPKQAGENLLWNQYVINSNNVQILTNPKAKQDAEIPKNLRVNISLQNRQNLTLLTIDKKSQMTYELRLGGPLTILQGFGFLIAMLQNKQN